MAALLTDDFHESAWTDQEVGIALGLGRLVVPVRLPLNPYGFVAKHQGLPGRLDQPEALATAIINVLLRRSETASRMRQALSSALLSSPSYATTKKLTLLVASTEGFTPDQLEAMAKAIRENNQVSDYRGVAALQRYVEKHRS